MCVCSSVHILCWRGGYQSPEHADHHRPGLPCGFARACAERVLSVCWACAGHVLGVFAACGWSTARMRAARRLSSTATRAASVKRGTVCRMAAFVGSAGGWQRQALVHGSLLEGVSARANDRLWSFCQSLHIIIENYAD